MSNYPPGVTGHEPEIAGLMETTWQVGACGAEIPAARVAVVIAPPPAGGEHTVVNLAACGQDEIECPYQGGTVDCQVDGVNGVVYWSCPVCGSDRVEQRDDEYVPPPHATIGDVIDRATGGPQSFTSLHCTKGHHNVCMAFYGGRSCECNCHVQARHVRATVRP